MGSQTNASIPKDRPPEHVTAGAGSASLSATSPVGPLGVSSSRFFLGAGAFLTQVHGGTRRCASLFCLLRFSMLRQALQNGASDAPDAFAAAALAPSSTPPEVCPETMEFDIRCTHGTTTTHTPHSPPQGGLGHDKHALPGRAFLAPAPSRAAAHLVITRKEIRCTRKMKNIKFVNPTRNKITGSRNMKTCRRRARGNFHLKAALDRVGILTVFSGENAMQQTALLPALERLLAGDAQQLRLGPLARRSARPRSCASTPSRSRFNAAVGDATDSVSDCEVGTREPAQEDAAAVATGGVEDCAESEQKNLFGHATGSRCPCLLPCQCVRVRVRVRVF